MEHRYTNYCNSNPAPENKDKKSNQFYSSVFSKAMRDSRLSVSLKKPPGGRKAPGYSPADLSKQEYRITRYVVPAINQEWKEVLPRSADSRSSIYDRFIQIDDVMCDMAVFGYIVKKHTVDLIPDDAREQLLALSDVEFDFTIATQFYTYIQDHHREELPELMKLIPSTPSGAAFSEILLGRTPVPSNATASSAREEEDEIYIGNSKK